MKNASLLYFFGILVAILFYTCCPKSVKTLKYLEGAPKPITTKIWSSSNDNLVFPEDNLNLKKTGICMSGGGSRAMVCAIGQLKGLWDIGVLDSVGYLSCVSGGSWASVPFTYNQDGASDNVLLGTIVKPLSNLSLSSMSTLEKGFLGTAANCPLFDVMLGNLGKYAEDDVWIQGVSECYMQPFGLYDQDSPKYFSFNDSTVADICKRNPHLSPTDFITVRNKKGDAKRPYLVVNSSISGPHEYAPFRNPEDLAVMNYTPLGIGSAVKNTGIYKPKESNKSYELPIGGGFIEPFAFGSFAPTSLPTICTNSKNGQLCVKTLTSAAPFPIANASGTSSSAFAAKFTSTDFLCKRLLSNLAPRMRYWPVSTTSKQKEVDFMFGDGGNLENLGAISLLQRKVNNLIVFVNTDTAIKTDYDRYKDGLPTKSDVSDDILTLFGVEFDGSQNMNKNQVFEQSDIYGLMTKLINAKLTGDSIIVKTTHITIPNEWWGINGGDTVNIVWVYNDLVEAFADSLIPDIRDQIKDLDGFPFFPYFPRYALIDEDLGRIVQLSAEQINLLYQFSAWHVYSNEEVFKDLLFSD